MGALNTDVEEISEYLSKKQKRFDIAMSLVRDIIRASGQAITMLHNSNTKDALARIEAAHKMTVQLHKFDDDFGHHTKQAYQEYAEAKIFSNIKLSHSILSCEDVKVDNESYLMGLMDVTGELKREILESLRKNKLKDAEFYFESMCEIYDSTRSIRFAEAILQGFRRKQDTARIQIENAGSEILRAKRK